MDYDTGGGNTCFPWGIRRRIRRPRRGIPPTWRCAGSGCCPWALTSAPADDPARLPFDSGAFDVLINRHGDYDPAECRRVLRPGGVFITEQVGADNDRDLVEMVLPGLEKPYPHQTLGSKAGPLRRRGSMWNWPARPTGQLCFTTWARLYGLPGASLGVPRVLGGPLL